MAFRAKRPGLEVEVREPEEKRHQQQPIGASPDAVGYSNGLVNMPGFPDSLRDKPQREDGHPGPRDKDAPYQPDYVRERRKRFFLVMYDLLRQFADKVAGLMGKANNPYWNATDGTDAMASLIADFTSGASPAPGRQQEASSFLSGLEPARREQIRKIFQNTVDAGVVNWVRSIQETDILKRFQPKQAAAQASAQTPQQAMAEASVNPSPAFRTEGARMVGEFDAAGGFPKAAAAASTAKPPPVREPVPTSAVRVDPSLYDFDAPGIVRAPLRAPPPAFNATFADRSERDRQSSERESIELEQKRKEQEEELKRKTGVAILDSNNQIWFDVDNPHLFLLKLLLRGNVTNAEIEAWRLIFGIPKPPATSATGRGSPLDTEEGRLKELKQLIELGTTLGSNNSGLSFVEAAEYTGRMVYSGPFSSAIDQAWMYVRNICRKPWVLKIDLMTHSEVRNQFAALVAHYIQDSQAHLVPRYSPSSSNDERRRQRHKELGAFFSRLYKSFVTDDNGTQSYYLAVDGITNAAANEERLRDQLHRDTFMASAGRYFSDAYDYQ